MPVGSSLEITKTMTDDFGIDHEKAWYFQKPDRLLPLSPVDTDVRWRAGRPGKAAVLHCQENVIADLGGFILP